MLRIIILSLAILPSIAGLFISNIVAQGPQGLDILSQLGASNSNSTIDIASSVKNVTVTKFSILSPQALQVDLRFNGTGGGPALKVLAKAIHLDSNLAQDVVNEITSLYQATNATNQTTSENGVNSSLVIDKELDKLSSILTQSNGTTNIDAGWKSPNNVDVKLSGNATLYNATMIAVVLHK
jgi:hypothetical protein